MTTAPANLRAVRTYLLAELNIHPGRVSADLEPDEVGIIAGTPYQGGYHCGSDWLNPATDYSTRVPRDRAGLTLDACALDTGWFSYTNPWTGQVHNLRTYSVWLVEQCKANTADSRHIREIIYSADGRVVKRWDREGRSTVGDDSHLTHTHESHYRDVIKSGRDLLPLYRRYITMIKARPPGPAGRTPEVFLVAVGTGAATRWLLSDGFKSEAKGDWAVIELLRDVAKAPVINVPATISAAALLDLAGPPEGLGGGWSTEQLEAMEEAARRGAAAGVGDLSDESLERIEAKVKEAAREGSGE